MVLQVCGGVGSGKSLVLAYLKENYGASIVGMDELAHELYEPGEAGYLRALELMGGEIRAADGSLDRKAMANRLYRKPDLLAALDATVHPLVYDRVEALARREKTKFLVVETALPARERNHIYNEIWYVFTPRALRIQRLMTSRGYTRERAEEIMERQMSDAAYESLADWTLVNDADEAALYRRIDGRLSGKELR